MAFYIKPPSGNTRYDQLAIFGRKRLQFLHQVLDCEDVEAFHTLLQQSDTAENSDCLIEGSKKDRISHFFLRLTCANDHEMSSFLIKSETQLFCLRFASMNSAELISLLKSTYKFVHHLVRRNSYKKDNIIKSAEDLHLVLNSALGKDRSWESLIRKYMDDDCEAISVPFQYALSLVRCREVLLNQGIAFVPCAKLHQILASLFEQIIADGLKRARNILRTVCEDERMVDLFKELRHLYYAGCRIGSTPQWDLDPIGCKDIDYLEQSFPPCMQNLHSALRKKHRLRHFSRIQYTLFLKEIGMPVHEAIRFWQREYSRPAANHKHSTGCDHSWSKDSKRYTYNIRHLYGLEGSRTNYSAHSCYSMQNCSLGHGEDGGCIFTHFDDRHLESHLAKASIPSDIQSSIFKLVQNKKYQSACEGYFLGRLRTKEEKKKWFFTSRSKSSEEELDVEELCSETDCKGGCCEKVIIKKQGASSSGIKENETKKNLDTGHERTKCASFGGEENDRSESVHLNKEMTGFSIKTDLSGSNHIEDKEIEETSRKQLNASESMAAEKVRCDEDNPRSSNYDCDVNIEKPSDYYFSYRQLLRSLQSMK